MASVTQYLANKLGKWDQKWQGTYGAAHVADVGRAEQAHNRYLSVVGNNIADIATATWTEAEAVYAIRLKAEHATEVGAIMRFVFDASPVDDATNLIQATSWLTPVASAVTSSVDIEYFEQRTSSVAADATFTLLTEWSEWFQFSSPLRRLDILKSSGADTAVNVFIEVA